MDTKIQMKISDILKIFISLNIVFSILALIFSGINAVINLQVAFFSSIFIVVGSFYGYRNNVLKQVDNYNLDIEDRDSIDKIEDQFDLYGEINEKEDLTDEEVKEIFKEEKEKIKTKDTIKNTFKTIGGATSIYRVIGYVLLVVGFFFLNNNQILNPIIYLLGFLIVPIMALIINYKYKKSSE